MPRVRRPLPSATDETQVIVEEPVSAPPGPPMPGAPLEEPPPNRELWPWLLVLLGLVIGGIVVAVLLSRDDKKTSPSSTQATTQAQTVAPLPRTTPAPSVVEGTVPKLVGLQAPAALEALAAAGLTGKTRGVFSAKPKNEVVGQDPAATTKVKKGSVVALEVSKGKQPVPVPDVVGQDVAAAIETVKAQGFQVNVVRVPSSDPAGQVVAQAPPAGKGAPGDSTVRLNVSDGAGGATTPPKPKPATPPTPKPTAEPKPKPKPAAPASVTVPDLQGLKLLAARKAIRKAGLVTEFKQVPSTEPKGTVVSQSPKPGETRKPGDHVLLNVSRGPNEQQGGTVGVVPDVTGEDRDTAKHDLEQAGFKVEVVEQDTTDPAEDGVVFDQNPEPGGSAPAKSTVTIYIGRYTGG
jgi:beta-lactam-binding protein with PASTA domain